MALDIYHDVLMLTEASTDKDVQETLLRAVLTAKGYADPKKGSEEFFAAVPEEVKTAVMRSGRTIIEQNATLGEAYIILNKATEDIHNRFTEDKRPVDIALEEYWIGICDRARTDLAGIEKIVQELEQTIRQLIIQTTNTVHILYTLHRADNMPSHFEEPKNVE